ncbi:MAG: hypothetical protein JXA94_06020 [Parachlamydiales bacterium]|nr:hypothetical protein [Parachlamydiales bacterium]
MRIKKIYFLLSMLLSFFAFADQGDDDLVTYNAMYKKQTHRYDQGEVVGKNNMTDGYNSPARIDTTGWDIYINSSFVYWQSRQRGLRFAATAGYELIPYVTKNLNYEFGPGFKVSLGMGTGLDQWTIGIDYLRYHTTVKDSKSPSLDPSIIPLIPFWRTQSVNASKIDFKWKLNLDILDLKVGRPFYEGTHLIARPYLGLRGGWIYQRVFSNTTTFSTLLLLEDRAKSDSWIIGPRAGVDADWIFGGGFSFFTSLAACIFYQDFDATYLEVNHTNPENLVLNIKNNAKYVSSNLDILAGFKWGMYNRSKSFHFSILAAYELQNYWAQNEMRHLKDISETVNEKTPGSLFLQGLTASINLDF